jgi:peroxiredoxin
MNVLKPRQPVPALEVDTLDGSWSLADQTPENFTMIVFYRGLHCPICTKYINELDRLSDDFAKIGVQTLAVSGDTRERAEQARQDWELSNLTVGYGVSVEQAREWGLHRSAGRGKTSIGIEEPAAQITRSIGARSVPCRLRARISAKLSVRSSLRWKTIIRPAANSPNLA